MSSLPGIQWTLLKNARIHTLAPGQPAASSLLLCNDRIAAVFGEPEPTLNFPKPSLATVDLHGATVCPGFTDSHLHLIDWGLTLSRVELGAARGIEDMIQILAARKRAEPPAPGAWVFGQGWSHNNWTDPTLPLSPEPLDRLYPENPVVLHSKCFHLAWANSAALRAAGITPETPSPAYGEIARDPRTGALTGILKEDATGLLDRAIGPASAGQLREALRRAARAAHEFGVTAVHNMESPDSFRIAQQARAEGELRLRIAWYLPLRVLDDLVRAGVETTLGDSWLQIAGVKIFTDGSLGGRTCWMFEPFEGEPGNTGIPATHGEELRAAIARANAHGLGCAVHAIGDRAIRETLEAFEQSWNALGESPQRERASNRIEHCQTVHPEDFARFGRMRVYAAMQASHLFADWRPADRYLGERARYTYALRTLARAGARIALGSDAPVETVDVAKGIYAAAYRLDLEGQPRGGWRPEERITAREALEAYCARGAEITGDLAWRGTIEPGKKADLVILPADPLTAAPEELREMRPLATILDGEWVFGSPEQF